MLNAQGFIEYVENFSVFNQKTEIIRNINDSTPRFTNEFWTSGQRQASSLHEVSYRACFKPQLPRFFIETLTDPGDIVFDPFSGRGTTGLEAALLNRNAVSNDINPLSEILASPRFTPPRPEDVKRRLFKIRISGGLSSDLDLSMFYEKNTLQEILSIQKYLYNRKNTGREDDLDRWIRMVATNRLTGHSPGFFSVYTMPPNQAASAKRQEIINRKRNQKPTYRNTKELIYKKTKSLLKSLTSTELDNLERARWRSFFLTTDARELKAIPNNYIRLTVTSPPFLKVVNYSDDNWLRCWFNRIDPAGVEITMTGRLNIWIQNMTGVFRELFRITKQGGFVSFEVGEVSKGRILLDEHVLKIGKATGFTPVCVLINKQDFTKTSNIWGIQNNTKGTNTNRIVVFQKTGFRI